MEDSKLFNADEEINRFNELEILVNETLDVINTVIDMFTAKAEIARGASGKLVLLVEQKISLLTRKESIIKNCADLKKNVFNANIKIINSEDGDTDFAKVLMTYTEEIKKQRQELKESKESAFALIEQVRNQDEVDKYFLTEEKVDEYSN